MKTKLHFLNFTCGSAIYCNYLQFEQAKSSLQIYPEQLQLAGIDAPLQKEICPPHFAAWVHQLREPRSADEWLQSDSVWIILFRWEKHSSKAISSICAQWGGLDSHRGAWTTPKQKSPTCPQGLLKYTPETGQLKMAGRECWVSCKLQTWKCSCEQPEKKKLSLGDSGLGLD